MYSEESNCEKGKGYVQSYIPQSVQQCFVLDLTL